MASSCGGILFAILMRSDRCVVTIFFNSASKAGRIKIGIEAKSWSGCVSMKHFKSPERWTISAGNLNSKAFVLLIIELAIFLPWNESVFWLIMTLKQRFIASEIYWFSIPQVKCGGRSANYASLGSRPEISLPKYWSPGSKFFKYNLNIMDTSHYPLFDISAKDLFQPKTSTFSTHALIWVHFKTLH